MSTHIHTKLGWGPKLPTPDIVYMINVLAIHVVT